MEQKKLTKSDLFSMFVRSNLQQASFNFERIHGLGFCYDMIPAIKAAKSIEPVSSVTFCRAVFGETTSAITGSERRQFSVRRVCRAALAVCG